MPTHHEINVCIWRVYCTGPAQSESLVHQVWKVQARPDEKLLVLERVCWRQFKAECTAKFSALQNSVDDFSVKNLTPIICECYKK